MDRQDESILVAPDVQNGHGPSTADLNRIGMRIGSPQVLNAGPRRALRHPKKRQQRRLGVRILRAILADTTLGDDSHGGLPTPDMLPAARACPPSPSAPQPRPLPGE